MGLLGKLTDDDPVGDLPTLDQPPVPDVDNDNELAKIHKNRKTKPDPPGEDGSE